MAAILNMHEKNVFGHGDRIYYEQDFEYYMIKVNDWAFKAREQNSKFALKSMNFLSKWPPFWVFWQIFDSCIITAASFWQVQVKTSQVKSVNIYNAKV